ncbi:MAG: DUF1611 domain-containing protein [Xanthomonadales bacterium]|nr:DUF1611 domain-containing protein [Xanthomonadales bacterium]
MTTTHQLKQPYTVFLGDVSEAGYAKTGFGLAHWRPDVCVAQLRFEGCRVDLGLPDIAVDDLKQQQGSLVIGVASRGGIIADSWIPALVRAAESGLDIVAGTHVRVADIPELQAAARRSGARLIDVRVPPPSIPVGTGERRPGKRLLTVGTDCAVGKKYTALALERAMHERGMDATFRASGQTGIMIAGSGIAIDAVVCDFTSGAAEQLSPAADDNHWDVIEGQGALHHPSYGGVSLGLLHGSQPDAIVLCHDASREGLLGLEQFPLPGLNDAIASNIENGRITNPDIRCVGVSVNTSGIDPARREALLAEYQQETGLPCVDPLIDGVGPIIDFIAEEEQ